MSIEKLRATVAELERELHSIDSVDGEARALLLSTIEEIRSTLVKSASAEPLVPLPPVSSSETPRAVDSVSGTLETPGSAADLTPDSTEVTENRHLSLADQLAETVQRLEVSHPTLVGVLKRLIDGLAQIGI